MSSKLIVEGEAVYTQVDRSGEIYSIVSDAVMISNVSLNDKESLFVLIGKG
jgi:hypothetical protein